MSETWRRWEGRTVDGKFPLQSYLGGSDHSAVFLTLFQGGSGDSERAAIKLIAADGANAKKQLLRWESARDLSHPNLIRILAAGRGKLDGTKLLYVVEEYAEENLSQILPERALTAEETRGMLPPILQALQFLQDKGFAHGHIQPSNILAIGDQVKLSSDALGVLGERRIGERPASAYDPPAAATGTISTSDDVWQLGMTLIEVLTQRLPGWDRTRSSGPEVPTAVPEPFREIARHCLQSDVEKRWTIVEISDGLEGKRAAPVPILVESTLSAAAILGGRRISRKWSYLLGLAAVVALAFILIPRPKPAGSTLDAQSAQAQPGSPGENAPGASGTDKASGNPDAAETDLADHGPRGDVVKRVVPEVSPGARHSIRGTIQVRVKVKVDAAGNVAKAKVESGRANKYFKRVALEAAQDWKFAPAPTGDRSGDREWKLQFAFSRAKTEASAVRINR